MQIQFEPQVLDPSRLALPCARPSRIRQTTGRPALSLEMLRRDALRAQAWEQAVWLALGMLGLAAVAVSFCGLVPLAIRP